MASTFNCLAFGGTYDWIIVAAIGLLLFGNRLPEVGKSLGKGIVEFKKGLNGIEDDIQNAVNNPSAGNRQKEMLPPPENRNFDPGTHTAATEQPVSQQQQQQQ